MKTRRSRKGNWKFFIGIGVGLGIITIIMAAWTLSSGVSFGNKIAVVNIRGTITSNPQFFMESVTPDDVLPMIERIEEEPSIRGALFVVNSGGGSVVASREIAQAMKNMEKPTVCWMGDIAASGAYWVASACDHIMADPLSMTGSIGVTASYLEFSELFDKYGVTYEQITSGERKDMGSPFRNLTEEERGKLEYIIGEIFNYFLDEVKENRNLTEEQLERVTSGDIFLGKDAVGLGLVDSLGTVKDAEEKVKELANAEQANLVTLKKKGLSLFDLLGMF